MIKLEIQRTRHNLYEQIQHSIPTFFKKNSRNADERYSVQHLPRRHVPICIGTYFIFSNPLLFIKPIKRRVYPQYTIPTYSQLIGFPSSKFNVLSCKTNVFHIVFFQTKIRAFLLFCGFLDKMTGMRLKKYVAIVIINFKEQTWGKRNGRLKKKFCDIKKKKNVQLVFEILTMCLHS